jgi:hypothetical protein
MDIFMNLEDAGRVTPNSKPNNFQSPSRAPQNNYNPQQRGIFNPISGQAAPQLGNNVLSQLPPQEVQKAMDIFFNLEKDNNQGRGVPAQRGGGGYPQPQQQGGYGGSQQQQQQGSNLQRFNPQEVNKAMDVFFNLEPGQAPKIRQNPPQQRPQGKFKALVIYLYKIINYF